MTILVPESGLAGVAHASSLPSRRYAWLVFALTFGLMLSDYLSRQVINAVFPLLKTEWALTDTRLGLLVSVVALLVGVMSFPVAFISDRVGRVKSAAAMAIVWGVATIACGLSGNFLQLVFARALVGLGEAGYGSAGGAVLISVFPPRQRATVMGGFLAAALFGSVLGVALGGVIAEHYGWRVAFILIGGAGLVLAVTYPFAVREPRRSVQAMRAQPLRAVIPALFAARSARWTYLGSGLQMFVQGSLVAWLPSFFTREHGMPLTQAALYAAAVVLVSGIGMTVCGALADRFSVLDPRNRLRLPAAYALATCVLLVLAFSLQPGPLQIGLIVAGAFFAGGHSGPAGAVVTDVSDPTIHATVLATLTLANNLLGLAPGPFVTGAAADALGLAPAMQMMPLMGLAAAAAFLLASRAYPNDHRSHEI